MVISDETQTCDVTALAGTSRKFGGVNEAKKCLHFFVNERRSELARDILPGVFI